MIQTPAASAGASDEIGFAGHTMLQSDTNGEFLFFHRNLRKWATGIRFTLSSPLAQKLLHLLL